MSELWKPVPGFEGYYECSNLGEFRHVGKTVNLAKTVSKRNGYVYVRLSKSGKAVSKRAHVMILLAHVGPRPSPRHETRHFDGTRTNNRLDNISWGTRSENTLDKGRHGTLKGINSGARNGRSKLTADEVFHIRNLRQVGWSRNELAAAFGVSKGTIYRVAAGRTWR